MQYLLTKEEYNSLVPQKDFIELQKKFIATREIFKSSYGCNKLHYGVCDNCPIASINSRNKICTDEKYSK